MVCTEGVNIYIYIYIYIYICVCVCLCVLLAVNSLVCYWVNVYVIVGLISADII